jgi:chaperonin cofactor prefoldin
LDERLSHLPTKDEFYKQTGEIIKRLDNLDEETDVLSHQVSKHDDRIEDLETRVLSSVD